MRRTAFLSAALILLGCSATESEDDHAHEDGGHAHDDAGSGWPITVWGTTFEIFTEMDPLATGSISKSHTHVTRLEGFTPLTRGKVSVVLRAADGTESVFSQHQPVVPGIFDVGIRPAAPGAADLVFRVESDGQSEDIAAGRVVIGDGAPGRLLGKRGSSPADAVAFTKEQQWATSFATVYVQEGALHPTVSGPAMVTPSAGGEVLITAPMRGLVNMDPWPYPGYPVEAGHVLFQVLPLVAVDESLARLQAEVDEAQADLIPLQGQMRRIEELHAKGGASDSQLEEIRAELTALQAHLKASREDLASARAVRAGVADGGQELRAPLTGAVSEVEVSRGQVVEPGDPLARVVRSEPLWIEVQLRPRDAVRVTRDPAELHVHRSGEEDHLVHEAGEVSLVSVAPEVDDETGRMTVILAVPDGAGRLVPGMSVTAEISLGDPLPGIVIPEATVIDDAGVPVVYVQFGGESFVRREVRVLARHGARLLVDGIDVGDRVVSEGGQAIRRTTLVNTGAGHGHVH